MSKKLKILVIVVTNLEYPQGASRIRPKKIIDAFKNTRHKVTVLLHRNKIKRLFTYVRILFTWYDICYIEPSTHILPNKVTKVMKFLKRRKTWISFYYRDSHWKTDIAKKAFEMQHKEKQKHTWEQKLELYKQDVNFLSNIVDKLYFPSNSFQSDFCSDLTIRSRKDVLPPGGDILPVNYQLSNRTGVIYVGGVGKGLYATDILLELFDQINCIESIPLTIICREGDYNNNTNLFSRYKNKDWCTFLHKDHNQLINYYSRAKIAVMPLSQSKYMDMCLPFKLYEYLSHNLPVIGFNNFEIQSEINNNSLGIVVDGPIEKISEKVIEYYNSSDVLIKHSRNTQKYIINNSWSTRVSKIINDHREEIKN